MTHQNLAVCFGPVLLTPTQDAWRGGGGKSGRGSTKGFYHGEEMASAVDFKRHIEALHYLLQLWPGKPYRPAHIPYLAMEPIEIVPIVLRPQCRLIEHQPTPMPCLLPPPPLTRIPWCSSSGILRCAWLYHRALKRRWWCHGEGVAVWPGWRVHRQSTGTRETGAFAGKSF